MSQYASVHRERVWPSCSLINLNSFNADASISGVQTSSASSSRSRQMSFDEGLQQSCGFATSMHNLQIFFEACSKYIQWNWFLKIFQLEEMNTNFTEIYFLIYFEIIFLDYLFIKWKCCSITCWFHVNGRVWTCTSIIGETFSIFHKVLLHYYSTTKSGRNNALIISNFMII